MYLSSNRKSVNSRPWLFRGLWVIVPMLFAPGVVAQSVPASPLAESEGSHHLGVTRARRTPITIDFSRPVEPARVGQPYVISLRYGSLSERASLEVYYHSDDPQGLSLASSQRESVILLPDETGSYPPQEVVLMPLQVGRYYLQISVGLQTDDGLKMRPYSIAVQVGSDSPRVRSATEFQAEEGISLPARMD